MKLGFITPEYPHEHNVQKVGGIGTSLKNLVLNMAKKGHRVTVFLYGMPENKVYIDEDVTTVFIKLPKPSKFSFYLNRKRVANVVNKYINDYGLDVVEAAEWSGITAFNNYACKVVLRLHGSDTYFCHLENRKLKKINYILEKSALKSADAIISVSQFTAELTKKLFSLNRKIEVIYNAIDLQKYKNEDLVHVQNNTILYFGTLIRKKGALDIPEIFNKVNQSNPSAKLILIGNDSIDYLENISTWELMQKKFTQSAFKNVDYKGSVPYDEMRKNIVEANVCIFPSYAEAFPVSWLEAMACKKPVVASNIGWAKETIQDGVSGLLCSPKSHEKYASKIEEILGDTRYAQSLGDAARDRIEKFFSAEKIVQDNIDFFEQLTSKEF